MSESLPLPPKSGFAERKVETKPKTRAAPPFLKRKGPVRGCRWITSVLAVGVLAGGLVLAACQPTPTPVPPTVSTINTSVSSADGMTLVFVPAGSFQMGSDSGYSDESPVHKVTLDAFWIDQTEVTNAMFQKFVKAMNYQTDAEKSGSGEVFNTSSKNWEDTKGADWQHPHGPSSNIKGLDDYPVVQVSWNDARAYCKWAGERLPTEAEWEKAARGTDARTYPWGNQDPAGNLLNFADKHLNISWADAKVDDGYLYVSPVGHYPAGASPYGALDMAGNVWDWVFDWYGAGYYGVSPAKDPTGPATGDGRVLRGGSWDSVAVLVRTTERGKNLVNGRADSLGFRCARSS